MNINLRKGLNREFPLSMTFNTSINNFFSDVFKPVVDIIFPPVCFLCDSLLEDNRKIVCLKCWSGLKKLTAKEVSQIRNIIINDNFDELKICYDFSDDFQKIIHLLKYERCITLAYYFSNEIIAQLNENFFRMYDYIIPVPLHPKKYRERGYNQSFEIVKHFPGTISKNILKRKRYTISQTTLSREERISNVFNAFKCVKNLQGTKILLFDDIITTGSTLNECASVLKKSGVSQVDVICLAAPLKHIY